MYVRASIEQHTSTRTKYAIRTGIKLLSGIPPLRIFLANLYTSAGGMYDVDLSIGGLRWLLHVLLV